MQTLKELKAALLGPYEVRKTWAQKGEFIAWARAYGERHGLSMRVEESGRLVRSRNLIFGEPEKADVLLTAHYDTCARLPFPNVMTPACWPVILLTQILLPVLVFGVLGVGAGYLVGRTMGALEIPEGLAAILASLTVSALCFLVAWLLMAGPQNPHTANDNTSGVALVLLAMEALCGREDVAFVLFDNEEKGMLGSSEFVKRHAGAARRVFVLNADCVSEGETLMLVGSKAAMRSPLGKRLQASLVCAAEKAGKRAFAGTSPGVFFPSDQLVFPKGAALAALRGKRVLYLDRIHTPRDTVFEDANLLCLLDAVTKALGQGR